MRSDGRVPSGRVLVRWRDSSSGLHQRSRRGRHRRRAPRPTAGGGSTRGLTDDTIRVGFIGADFAALAEAGLAPDLGDQPKIVQSVVDQINEDGGIGGRQVEVRVHARRRRRPRAGQAACLEMTQDFEAFAVVLGPAIGRGHRPLHRGHQRDAHARRHRLRPGAVRRGRGPAVHRRLRHVDEHRPAVRRAGPGCSTTRACSTAGRSASSPPSSPPSSRPPPRRR